jgi:uncharacterized membrane protein YvlD (DUF360 family)
MLFSIPMIMNDFGLHAYVHGFWLAVFGSLIISLVSWMPSSFLNERRQDQLYRSEKNGQRYLAITQSEL